MKRQMIVILVILMMLITVLAGCTSKKEQKVTCVICNGTGEVKYYYGEGDRDFNMGPCTSCDEKGYNMVTPSDNSGGGKKVICGSCEKYVDELITKNDAAGENRTWCSDCWQSYDDIMGR